MLHPVMVRVALRDCVEVLAWKLTLMVPLLLPDVGDTVAHAGAPLTVQALQLLVTEMPAEPAAAVWLMVVGLTSKEVAVPVCVIVTVREMLQPVMVRVALRDCVEVLA